MIPQCSVLVLILTNCAHRKELFLIISIYPETTFDTPTRSYDIDFPRHITVVFNVFVNGLSLIDG